MTSGVCSFCLCRHVLRDGRPIRHGFSVTTIPGQGLLGAWHSGPCPGTHHVDLWESDEGLRSAIQLISNLIRDHKQYIARLDKRPVISYTAQGRYLDRNRRETMLFEVRDGDASGDRLAPLPNGQQRRWHVPSYEALWTQQKTAANLRLLELVGSREQLQRVLETWRPGLERYARLPHEAPRREAVLHLNHRNMAACKRSYSVRGGHVALAESPEQVTCSRCLKRVGSLPRIKEGV